MERHFRFLVLIVALLFVQTATAENWTLDVGAQAIDLTDFGFRSPAVVYGVGAEKQEIHGRFIVRGEFNATDKRTDSVTDFILTGGYLRSFAKQKCLNANGQELPCPSFVVGWQGRYQLARVEDVTRNHFTPVVQFGYQFGDGNDILLNWHVRRFNDPDELSGIEIESRLEIPHLRGVYFTAGLGLFGFRDAPDRKTVRAGLQYRFGR